MEKEEKNKYAITRAVYSTAKTSRAAPVTGRLGLDALEQLLKSAERSRFSEGLREAGAKMLVI